MSLSQQRVPSSSTMTLQALLAQSNSRVSDMNSIYSAVIKVFRGEGLHTNELYFLNERIRWLLKTEMGSFIEEYFQNQLLNNGLETILEEVQIYEGEGQLFFLGNVWVRFFSEILPMLQAIFYPLQGHEFTVRQMALLAFRDLVLMRLPLEELLPTNHSLLPTSIRQMLLVLQGVHEPRGPTMEYFRLEKMLEMVVSPYLWNCKHKSCETEIRQSKHLIQPVIRITQHTSEASLLTPLPEHEGEGHAERRSSLRLCCESKGRSVISERQFLTVTRRLHSGIGVTSETDQISSTFKSQSC